MKYPVWDFILCKLNRHDYFLIKTYSKSCRKLGCRKCSRLFVMNDDIGCVIPHSKDFDEMAEVLRKEWYYHEI